jgi:hypothetical protein
LKQVDAFLGENAAQLLLAWYFDDMYALYGADVVQAIVDVEDAVEQQIEQIFIRLGEESGMELLRSLNTSQRLLFFARYLAMFLDVQNTQQTGAVNETLINGLRESEQTIRLIIPAAQDGLSRELLNRIQPVNGDVTALWDSNNPFAPIIITEPFVPDDDFFKNFTLIFKP